MIKEFAAKWPEIKPKLEEAFRQSRPVDYKEILQKLLTGLNPGGETYGLPDPERIQEVDWGDYQGALVFVVGATGYQPGTHWVVQVDYGSCSHCDTLEGLRGYYSDPLTPEETAGYVTLALHMLQGLWKIPNRLLAEGEDA